MGVLKIIQLTCKLQKQNGLVRVSEPALLILKILIKKYCHGSVNGTFEKEAPGPEPNVGMKRKSIPLTVVVLS